MKNLRIFSLKNLFWLGFFVKSKIKRLEQYEFFYNNNIFKNYIKKVFEPMKYI